MNKKRNTVAVLAITSMVVTLGGRAHADFTFGEPMNLGSVINSSSSDYGPCLSTDGLELYFTSERAGGSGGADIWVSTRQGTNDQWNPPTNLGPTVNSSYNDSYPTVSSDGLTLYFSDAYSGTPRPVGLGGGDIWMTTRPNRNAPWGEPVNLGAPINSSTLDMSPTISGDNLILIFTSNNRAGGRGSWDLWMSTRADVQDPWDPPVNLGQAVNSGNWEGECGLSGDGRVVFFGSGRAGIAGGIDIWMSTRKTLSDPWNVAVNLGSTINKSGNDGTARVSPDMRTLYFCSDRPGGLGNYDLYAAPIIPVADFNGDGVVDEADMFILVDCWHTDNPMCDIGPAPWGDGIVDVQDLIVLNEQWFGLLAYWMFDETEGDVAYDSVGTNDGVVMGNPVWQSGDGMVGGALAFDGIDDCVATEPILNPWDRSFSVFAWIKGGAPGRTFLSQANGENWLLADSSGGYLMTELKGSGRTAGVLQSQTVVTDGDWHRVGLVWDGLYRRLYVDDVVVVEDTQDGLEISSNGLYIGTGKSMEDGTFWSGLIDDVRIYNRAVHP
jgi:hypothetical protein